MKEDTLLSYLMDTPFVRQIEKDYHGHFTISDLKLICNGSLNILNGRLMLDDDCVYQADIYFSLHIQLVEGKVITNVLYGTSPDSLFYQECASQMYEKINVQGTVHMVRTPFRSGEGFEDCDFMTRYPYSYRLTDGLLSTKDRKRRLREEAHLQKKMKYGCNHK